VFSDIDESSKVMLISQYGKIIRMDSSTIRESGAARKVSACCTWKRETAWGGGGGDTAGRGAERRVNTVAVGQSHE